MPRREGDDRRDKEGLHGAKGDSSMRELLRRGRGPGVDWRRRSAAAEQAHNGRLREVTWWGIVAVPLYLAAVDFRIR